ncbi:MAG: hypothetical protein KatS3mg082_1950 [Nitrospiraceae bacterium]|nr:MAG: hypothetical protein KatS3mg082_1950 [Nitrospiraceae bacterium]
MPSHGRFVGASSQPFSRVQAQGRVTGWGTIGASPTSVAKRAVRHVVYDTNYWKSFIHARLAVPMGERGCLSLVRGQAAAASPLSPNISRPSTASRPRAAAAPSTNGRCVPSAATTTGLTAWSGCAVAASIQGAAAGRNWRGGLRKDASGSASPKCSGGVVDEAGRLENFEARARMSPMRVPPFLHDAHRTASRRSHSPASRLPSLRTSYRDLRRPGSTSPRPDC